MVPLPALLTALLSCQLAGLVLAPHRQLGSLHGHAGLGACVQVAEHPWCPAQGAQRSPGHFLGPHSGQRGMWEAVMGEFLVPRAGKSTQLLELS